MDNQLEVMTYMIAAEKMSNMLFTIEQTMQFMIEYSVTPDEEVKKALNPMLEQMRKWIGNG